MEPNKTKLESGKSGTHTHILGATQKLRRES